MDSLKTSGVHFSIINWSWNICQIGRTLTIQKNSAMIFTYFKFFEFESGLRETERSQNRGIDRCYSSISWQRNDGSTFGHSFQDSMTSQSRAIPFQSRKIVKFEKIMALIFLNCESKFDSTDVPSWIYDRKTAARPFDTIHDILRCLSLAQSILKGRNAPIWRIGNRGVKKLRDFM